MISEQSRWGYGYLISESTVLRVNKVHRVSTATTTVEILQGPAWTLIRGPRWRVEKKNPPGLYCI